jgi:hypothetical protein
MLIREHPDPRTTPHLTILPSNRYPTRKPHSPTTRTPHRKLVLHLLTRRNN